MFPLTLQALTHRPMQAVRRYFFAALGATAAMSLHIFMTNRAADMLERLAWALPYGLLFGVMMGGVVMVAGEVPARLRHAWHRGARTLLALGGGVGAALLTWLVHNLLYLRNTQLDWDVLLLGAAGLSAGFILTALLDFPPPFAILITAACIFAPIFGAYYNFMSALYDQQTPNALLYYGTPDYLKVGLLLGAFAFSIALGGHFLALWQSLQRVWRRR